ncbi:hypothetical protein FHX42_002783 [Saccharopolyspora lacisalsi]|uniref:DUF1648 domain-containing protein n=1 Tax=Halosaccharopolyspora lacisalsi TaxID=1000566 RepID=A0A839DTX4_9PSEU|nr:DUF1648 domain-containing protein [Halosaccharopolyspora lacisalsi]MBA8825432.1 hypothetical protein [Halosaccharopolyspora lacisalsi]
MTTPRGHLRRVGMTFGIPVVAAAVILVFYLTWLPRLPERLATHFGMGGRADGFTSVGAFPFVMPTVTLGFGVLFGLLALAMRRNPFAQRLMSAAAGGVALMMLAINVLLLHEHLDVADSTAVTLPGWHIGTVGIGMAVGGALGWFAAGSTPAVEAEPPPDVHTPVREPAVGETVSWRRSQTSPVIGWIMVGMLPVVVLTCAVSTWWLLALHIPVYLLLASFARVVVEIDDSGLTLRMLAGLPRIHVPVPELRTAYSRDIAPLRDFSGWGWRSNSTACGLVLRSGSGLWVHRKQREPLAVTVPDAEEAAALLNGLRDRRAAGGR